MLNLKTESIIHVYVQCLYRQKVGSSSIFFVLLTAPVCVAGGWTRGLLCPTSHRDEFEIPNLEDLRLEIPGDEPNTLYISAIGTFSLKQTK